MSESTDKNSRSPASHSTAVEKRAGSSSHTSPESVNVRTNMNTSMVMRNETCDPHKKATAEDAPSDKDADNPALITSQPAAEGGSAEEAADAADAADSGSTGGTGGTGEEGGSAEQSSELKPDADATSADEPADSGNEQDSTNDLGSEEASTTEEGPTSDLNSETTNSPGTKDPGKMVSRALEYDLQDMYPEITLLFEDKPSAWNCQDPATIRAMWLESRTNILRDWKLRNGRIKSNEKPKLEVKPNMATTLRKQFLSDKAKAIDWRDMYIPPGNDAPKYEALTLPTNKVTEVRYNFTRNNPPVPSSYVLHYEKYRRPPFNVFQPQTCRQFPEEYHL